jgi:hypothetical protein
MTLTLAGGRPKPRAFGDLFIDIDLNFGQADRVAA